MTKKTDQKQTLKEKLHCPLYPRKLGKKLFLYSLTIWIISLLLFLEISNDSVAHVIKNISLTAMFSSLVGAILWAGITRGGNNDDLRNSDISISGSHRMTNIHNMNNPANPLSYHHRNS